jgi:hypothetical protein
MGKTHQQEHHLFMQGAVGDRFRAHLVAAGGRAARVGALGRRARAGKITHLFGHFLYQNASFYQDRLGTNIGKAALKKRGVFSCSPTPSRQMTLSAPWRCSGSTALRKQSCASDFPAFFLSVLLFVPSLSW